VSKWINIIATDACNPCANEKEEGMLDLRIRNFCKFNPKGWDGQVRRTCPFSLQPVKRTGAIVHAFSFLLYASTIHPTPDFMAMPYPFYLIIKSLGFYPLNPPIRRSSGTKIDLLIIWPAGPVGANQPIRDDNPND